MCLAQPSFDESLNKDIATINKTLPKSYGDGIWLWSMTYANKVCTIIIKTDKSYSSYKSLMDSMAEEYAKAFVHNMGGDALSFIKHGVSIKMICKSKDTNKTFYTLIVPPQKIKTYYNELKSLTYKNKGNRPLSYYQNGFTADNKFLPRAIDEYTIYYRVSMPSTTVYYDYYLDDELANIIVMDKSGTGKAEMKSEIISFIAPKFVVNETKQDFIIYGIKMEFRYYYKSSKKLAFIINVNPPVDCW